MYVCMCVCIYVMYVCLFVFMYACMHACMYACMYVCVCMYACMPIWFSNKASEVPICAQSREHVCHVCVHEHLEQRL